MWRPMENAVFLELKEERGSGALLLEGSPGKR